MIPFVNDCAAMFAVQARESGIHMTVVNHSVVNHSVVNHSVVNHSAKPESPSMKKKSFLFAESLLLDPLKKSFSPSTIFSPATIYSPPFDLFDSVFIDKFKMDQVVRNLISNALKFTPRGGTVLVKYSYVPSKIQENEVRHPGKMKTRRGSNVFRIPTISQIAASDDDLESAWSMAPTEGCLVLEVTDDGAGISAENQTRLFNDIVQFNPEVLQAGEKGAYIYMYFVRIL